MSKFAVLAKAAEHFVKDNSPTILTGVGVVGTVGTAVLAGKASWAAGHMVSEQEVIFSPDNTEATTYTYDRMSNLSRAKLVWKLYIPATACGAATVTSIILANRIGLKKTAALAAAYAITDKAYTEYKDKVVEKFSQKKHEEIKADIAQDHVNRDQPSATIIVGTGKVLCKDLYSGRYFESTVETLKKAQNDINYNILHSDYATLTEFYDKIGIEPTSSSDYLGWNTEKQLEIDISTAMTDDGRPVITFDFATVPINDPWRFQ